MPPFMPMEKKQQQYLWDLFSVIYIGVPHISQTHARHKTDYVKLTSICIWEKIMPKMKTLLISTCMCGNPKV